jgi:hypothetical protein
MTGKSRNNNNDKAFRCVEHDVGPVETVQKPENNGNYPDTS